MGSEMCIRDRLLTAAKNGGITVRAPFQKLMIGFRCSVINALPQTCLLYTSDAADERSSVDLGGRRIIKKKTHELTVG